MENRDDKSHKTITKLLINSIEDDLDSLLKKEFYDSRHTPSYALKLVSDSIANHPTVESCLTRGQYISFLSKENDNESRLRQQNIPKAWQSDCEQNLFLSNRSHRYLSETELTTEHTASALGRPTRATLLKERMRWSCSRPGSVSTAPQERYARSACCSARFNKMISDKNRQRRCHDREVDYGFLVGARYNASHFLDLNCVRDKGLYVSKTNHGIVFVNSGVDQFVESDLESPPNSPETTHNNSLQSPNCINKEVVERISVRGQTKTAQNNQSRPITSPHPRILHRPHTLDIAQKPTSHKGLPVVIGSKWMPINSNYPVSHSRPPSRASLSRSAVNLHFAKQNRFLQNRYHDNSRNKKLELMVTSIASSPEFNGHTVTCDDCLKCA